MKTEELVVAILEIVQRTGKVPGETTWSFQEFAETLNAAGIKPMKAAAWNGRSVERFWQRNCQDLRFELELSDESDLSDDQEVTLKMDMEESSPDTSRRDDIVDLDFSDILETDIPKLERPDDIEIEPVTDTSEPSDWSAVFDSQEIESPFKPSDASKDDDLVTQTQLNALIQWFQSKLGVLTGEIDRLKTRLDTQQEEETISVLRPPAPQAPQKGQRKAGERRKIAGTIDKVLMDLIEKEQRARGATLSAMLDTMVWYYFGRPDLSFQVEEDMDQ